MSLLTEYLELQRTTPLLMVGGSPLGGAGGPGGQGGGQDPLSALCNQTSREAMNKLIMNYLITEGSKEAAEKFQEEANLPAPAEIHDMENRIRIRDCIQAGQIGQAISQVHNLHPELLDDDRYLFFHLQQQQLIELIREQRVEEALRFATDQLAERGEEDPGILEELERTMALLAFQDPNQSPFSDLLSDSHRQKVASELNAALLRAEHADCTQPRLASVLKMLLWSQSELDKKGVSYPKMYDLATGETKESK